MAVARQHATYFCTATPTGCSPESEWLTSSSLSILTNGGGSGVGHVNGVLAPSKFYLAIANAILTPSTPNWDVSVTAIHPTEIPRYSFDVSDEQTINIYFFDKDGNNALPLGDFIVSLDVYFG